MINLIEELICTEDGPISARLSEKSTYCKIIWIKKGKGEVLIDLERFPIIRNRVFLITPGQMYLLKPAGTLEGYAMLFCADMCTRPGNFNDFIHPAYGRHIEMEGMLRLVMEEHKRCLSAGVPMPAELMEVLFIYLMRMRPIRTDGQPLVGATCLAGRFLQLLRENTATRKQVSDFASELAITPNHLNHIMKRSTGQSARYHIQQHLLLEAKRRLLYGGYSAKQIAYSLGFEDAAHFSKFFKRCAGTTFTAFRHSIREQIP